MTQLVRGLLFCSALLAVSCATGSTGGGDDAGDVAGDSRPEDTASDGSGQAPADVSDAEDGGDTAGVDTGSGDTINDVVPDAPDTAPDLFPDDCEATADECEPFSVACDGDAVVFCSRCGFELRREECAEDEVCEFSEGAGRCRPCVGDECPEQIDCEANTRSCFDFDSQLICGSDGRVQSIGDCPVGRRCLDGVCQQPGQQTGAACTEDSDPEVGCAGQLCLCSTADQVANGDAICAPFPNGYCSTRDCAANGCNPDSEVCVDLRATGDTRAPFCVTTEECATRGALCGAAFRCNELPSAGDTGDLSWDWGCWPPVGTIGEACASDRDCLGGECRSRDVGGTQVSYCVAPCGEGVGCPSHASCVTDPEDGSNYICLANGNATDCPRTETQRLLIDRTPPRMLFGGGSASVCYFAN